MAGHQMFSQNRHHRRHQGIAQNGLQKVWNGVGRKISVGKRACAKSIGQAGLPQKAQQLHHQVHHQHHAGCFQYILRHVLNYLKKSCFFYIIIYPRKLIRLVHLSAKIRQIAAKSGCQPASSGPKGYATGRFGKANSCAATCSAGKLTPPSAKAICTEAANASTLGS